jgi:hypothetical protein
MPSRCARHLRRIQSRSQQKPRSLSPPATTVLLSPWTFDFVSVAKHLTQQAHPPTVKRFCDVGPGCAAARDADESVGYSGWDECVPTSGPEAEKLWRRTHGVLPPELGGPLYLGQRWKPPVPPPPPPPPAGQRTTTTSGTAASAAAVTAAAAAAAPRPLPSASTAAADQRPPLPPSSDVDEVVVGGWDAADAALEAALAAIARGREGLAGRGAEEEPGATGNSPPLKREQRGAEEQEEEEGEKKVQVQREHREQGVVEKEQEEQQAYPSPSPLSIAALAAQRLLQARRAQGEAGLAAAAELAEPVASSLSPSLAASGSDRADETVKSGASASTDAAQDRRTDAGESTPKQMLPPSPSSQLQRPPPPPPPPLPAASAAPPPTHASQQTTLTLDGLRKLSTEAVASQPVVRSSGLPSSATLAPTAPPPPMVPSLSPSSPPASAQSGASPSSPPAAAAAARRGQQQPPPPSPPPHRHQTHLLAAPFGQEPVRAGPMRVSRRGRVLTLEGASGRAVEDELALMLRVRRRWLATHTASPQ